MLKLLLMKELTCKKLSQINLMSLEKKNQSVPIFKHARLFKVAFYILKMLFNRNKC